ncbi:bifunctional copper resistance protein CopD/cytochrome c oxidase assembly protein [Thermopolyspora sp. NPDC052614]|uniref:bifunctional copper resistance protein CopD/cytochrome c oxidase assembly protein n=1 Tax=Thermopolyspora sp. NPDC052614 TaxID=3155682 RepID=UPI00341E0A9E
MGSRVAGSARSAYGGAVVAAGVGMLAVGLWVGGGRPRTAIPGLPSPGPVTLWGLPLVRLVLDVCAVMTVGILVTATVLTMGRDEGARARITRGARWWAAAWALSAALNFVLTLSDFLGLPVQEALASETLVSFAFQIPQGRAFLLVGVLAAVVAVACAGLGRVPFAGSIRVVLSAVAVFATLPPAYVGHSATAADHNLAVSSLLLHIAAVAVWTGGLAGLLLCLRGSPDLGEAVGRFSALALGCFVAVGVSGLYNAWIRLGALSALWESPYGLLVLGKLVALVALGCFGAWHRRRTIAALNGTPIRSAVDSGLMSPPAPDSTVEDMPGAASDLASPPAPDFTVDDTPGAASDLASDAARSLVRSEAAKRRPFLRLAAGEVVVMAATIGLAVALSRTPPPDTEVVYGQEGLLGYAVPPIDAVNLLTQTRLDPLLLLPLAWAALAYLLGVRRLSRAGRRWPVGRTALWLGGLLVLAYALAGGVAAYAPAMFSVTAAQYALAGIVAPALLVFGAPLTLVLAATAPGSPFGALPRVIENGPVARAVAHPAAAFAVHAVPYLLLYPFGLFGVVQPEHGWRLATLVVLVGTGVVFFAVVAGVDPMPRPVPLPTRLRLLGTAIALHATLALYVMAGPALSASWYGNLALEWAPVRGLDQVLGAMVGLAGTTATLVALIVTLLVWRLTARRRLRRPSSRVPVSR